MRGENVPRLDRKISRGERSIDATDFGSRAVQYARGQLRGLGSGRYKMPAGFYLGPFLVPTRTLPAPPPSPSLETSQVAKSHGKDSSRTRKGFASS